MNRFYFILILVFGSGLVYGGSSSGYEPFFYQIIADTTIKENEKVEDKAIEEVITCSSGMIVVWLLFAMV